MALGTVQRIPGAFHALSHHRQRNFPTQSDLPPTAIGKDYLGGSAVFGRAPSGTGYQLSFGGVVGVLAALREGIEVNLLGLVVGVRPWPLAVKLPGVGT